MFRFAILSVFRLFALMLAVAFAATAIAGSAVAGPDVIDVRFGVHESGRTRIVLDIEGNPQYRAYLSSEDDRKRLQVDIAKSGFEIGGAREGHGDGLGSIGQYRFVTDADGTARLSFDLAETAVPQAVFLIKPKGDTAHHRLVIDMDATSEADFAASLERDYGPLRGKALDDFPKAQPVRGEPAADDDTDEDTALALAALDRARKANEAAAPKRVESPITLASLPTPRIKPEAGPIAAVRPTRGFKVLIDAGHGGRDPGAIGQNGNYEKDVVLASALALEEILSARGYVVVMTRRDDVKISLDDRIPRWQKENADLFISIHADSVDRADVRGASVYTLSDKGELRLANQIRNGKAANIAGVDLTNEDTEISRILADYSTSVAQEASAVFANMLIENLDGEIPMVGNSHREENLMVLLAPDMPAVLLELGFMSNIHDEANLVRDSWRRRTMTLVADSVDSYFATLPSRHARFTEGAR